MKMGNKKELKSIAEENSDHLNFKNFLKYIIIVQMTHIRL